MSFLTCQFDLDFNSDPLLIFTRCLSLSPSLSMPSFYDRTVTSDFSITFICSHRFGHKKYVQFGTLQTNWFLFALLSTVDRRSLAASVLMRECESAA